MKIVFIGLTISSSWGNGHATTYRGLVKELVRMDHEVYFLEHDKPWYRGNRDFDTAEDFQLIFYQSIDELKKEHQNIVADANMVIVGSYVPQGVEVAEWVLEMADGVTAFYDIDTPVTLQKMEENDEEYINRKLIPLFDLYLSFAGGEVLDLLEDRYGASKARALYCSVDPDLYYPMEEKSRWDMGYLGTYSDDRQPTVEKLLIDAAENMVSKRFVVAGPSYPQDISWPKNVDRIEHLPPSRHCRFYNQQAFTLNVTREAMIKLGYSPSVRLFEAAACGVPIISDYWKGLTDLFEEKKEIMVARSTEDILMILNETTEEERKGIGMAARQKVLDNHTSTHRALSLISYYEEIKNPVILK